MEKKLFVFEEDGDAVMPDISSSELKDVTMDSTKNIDIDDPIVEEIPINLTASPCPINILQYTNMSNKLGKRLIHDHSVKQVRYKEKSRLLEMDIPLNTNLFFDQDRAKEEWNGVDAQTLKGVGVPNGGQYAGLMHEKQLYLLHVDTVTQMRPYFKYIDHIQQLQKKKDDLSVRESSGGSIGPVPKAQVVTMSVKSSSEANQNRIGGSLLAHKIAEDEMHKILEWKYDTFENFLAEVTAEDARKSLNVSGDTNSYLEKLI